MSNPLIVLIPAMAIATYFSRVLPFLAGGIEKLGPRSRRFLSLVPAAALGALILPGAFTAVPSAPIAGIVGVLASIVTVRLRGGLVLPVLIAVLVSWLVLGLV